VNQVLSVILGRGLAAILLLGPGLPGCATDIRVCAITKKLPIFYGHSEPQAESLRRERELGVGQLEITFQSSFIENCTGTAIGPRTVLGAAHCFRQREGTDVAGITFQVGDEGSSMPERQYRGTSVSWHATLDLALVTLDETLDASIQKFAIVDEQLDRDWEGLPTEVVGYGLTEAGVRGHRKYLPTSIAFVEDTYVLTDGRGRQGACNGDSGAPMLLARDEPTLIGVLSAGSSSCVGIDRFTRVDIVLDWLDSQVDMLNCAEDEP
jgi:secreted trypsin-like serine protease